MIFRITGSTGLKKIKKNLNQVNRGSDILTIVNVLGKVMKIETINGLVTIDVSALHAGIYFVQDLKLGKAIQFIKE